MVNIQGGTRMMVNRCMELLRARIECAHTRHIARRHQRPGASMHSQFLPDQQALREREKADTYNKNKRRSLWEQDDGYGGRFSEIEDQKRLDAKEYRAQHIEERKYDCTWDEFPEYVVEKKNPYSPHIVEEAPRRRRAQSDRPITAKPCDDEAVAFISQWDNNSAMINRNKFMRSSDAYPRPMMSGDQMDNAIRNRKKQFYY